MSRYGQRYTLRAKTTDLQSVDIRDPHIKALVPPHMHYRDKMTLKYTLGSSDVLHEKTVLIHWTPCNYGGVRPWFGCDLCGKRVAVLYLGRRGFGCRRCYDLRYDTQVQEPWDRLITRKNKILDRIGGSTYGDRPRYMHRKTYWRIVQEADYLESRATVEFYKSHFGIERG